MNYKAFEKYLATGEYVPTEDGIGDWAKNVVGKVKTAFGGNKSDDLAAHDRKFHPNGYKEGDSCKLRESLSKKDKADDLSGVKSPTSGSKAGDTDAEDLAFLKGFLGDEKGAKEELAKFKELEHLERLPTKAERRDLARMEWIYGDSPHGKKMLERVKDEWDFLEGKIFGQAYTSYPQKTTSGLDEIRKGMSDGDFINWGHKSQGNKKQFDFKGKDPASVKKAADAKERVMKAELAVKESSDSSSENKKELQSELEAAKHEENMAMRELFGRFWYYADDEPVDDPYGW